MLLHFNRLVHAVVSGFCYEDVVCAATATGFVRQGTSGAIGTEITAFMRYRGQGHEIAVALPLRPFLQEDCAGLKALFDQRFGGKGKELVALYRKYDPSATPYLIQAQALTDSGFRRSAYTQATRKAQAGKAPAYMYQWNWRTPAYDSKFGAVHGIDVSASFHSYRDGFFAGSTPGKRMADRLASAWGAFVRTGPFFD